MVKLFVTETACRVALEDMQMLGGCGYSYAGPLATAPLYPFE